MNKERVAALNKEREVVNKEREEWNPHTHTIVLSNKKQEEK